ncbi:MAG: TetR/AcrR family transcriptional regulator [Planctomycetes bacterium]|nr:TetR/AcrR family transcriptional regulator [Planctomycetota bacterium]
MRASDRREQLLNVAAKLFAERGYRGATTADLAAAAGVTEPIIYRHFENKLDLFVTLIDVTGREALAACRKSLTTAVEPGDRLHALLEGHPAMAARPRGTYRVILHALAEPAEQRAITAALRRHLSSLQRFVADEIEVLQDDGVVRRDLPPAALAWLIVQTGIGCALAAPLTSGRDGAAGNRRAIRHLMEELMATA